LEYYNWTGVFAPARTPPDVIAALRTLVGKAVEQPEFKEPLGKAGSAPDVLTGEAFAVWFKANSEANEAAVQAVGKVQ
jgi:tripartite-type tricarboxylate transporter receptor subunit TctC